MKILIGGNSRAVIDDFFSNMPDDFECMTTSGRIRDVKNHVRYFEPDAFVYCVREATADRAVSTRAFREYLRQMNIPFFLIGTKEDLAVFDELCPGYSDTEFEKPYDMSEVISAISSVSSQFRAMSMDNNSDTNGSTDAKIGCILKMLRPGKKKKVLVIDDDSVILKTLKRYLEDDYDVAIALNGKLALKYLESKSADLILLDYVMPDMDGAQVLNELRANAKTADIPVVFLTGLSDTDKIQQILDMKVEGYLIKPADNAKLHEIIEEILNR